MTREELKAKAQAEIERFTMHLQGVTAKSSPLHEGSIQTPKYKKSEKELKIFSLDMQEKNRRAKGRIR